MKAWLGLCGVLLALVWSVGDADTRHAQNSVHTPNSHLWKYGYLSVDIGLRDDTAATFTVTQQMENLAWYGWNNAEWSWAWGPDALYTNIRAWDTQGDLSVVTFREGDTLWTHSMFRENPLPVGSPVLLTTTVTVSPMARHDARGYYAGWYWSPGAVADTFIETLRLPRGMTFSVLSPQTQTQFTDTAEWRFENWNDANASRMVFTRFSYHQWFPFVSRWGEK